MQTYVNQETICAVSTPAGSGAIAVIRLSGKKSLEIINRVFIHSKTTEIQHSACVYGQIFDGEDLIDDVVVTFFEGPRSYTGEDTVEISCHGSHYIQQRIMELLIRNGANTALPGEFTFRAYRNGKLDLAQSEAVADLISSENKKSHDIAIAQLKGNYSSLIKQLRDKLIELLSLLELELDFSEEDVEFANRDDFNKLLKAIEAELEGMKKSFELGNALRTGIPVTIIGQPNVGKSTLLNCLLDEDKAIVSEIPGTTRDVIEDVVNIDGYLFRFVDTAGLHQTDDVIENIGIGRTIERIKKAEIVLHVFDAAEVDKQSLLSEIEEFRGYLSEEERGSKKWMMIGNKVDNINELPSWFNEMVNMDAVFISAKRKENIELVVEKLSSFVRTKDIVDTMVVTNVRHYDAMEKALKAVKNAKDAFSKEIPADLVAIDIHEAAYNLGSIVGEVTSEEVLDSIFGKFCIGK